MFLKKSHCHNKFTQQFTIGFVALLLLMVSSVSYAAGDPVQLLQKVSNQMINALKKK